MLFRQILNEDLGCASYLVGDSASGVAAVIDPQWDIDPYLRLSRLHGVRIEHVLETHNHADHVSGHGRLARATGATIHINELADAEYPHEAIADGWSLELGEVGSRRMHTPGHRPEHTSFVAPRHRPRRRAMGGADRRLPVRRRRRPPRPRGRAAGRCGRHLPLAARAAAVARPTTSRSGRATSAVRPAAAPGSTTRAPRRSASSASTTTRFGSTTRRVRRARGHYPGRQAAEHRAHRRDQPRAAGRAARHPLPLDPPRRRGRDRRGRAADRRPDQRAVRRGPHPRRDQRLGLRHRVRHQGREGRPARRRADRRRGLRRLRARGRRAARLGRPARPRLPRRRDDGLAHGGAPGPADRADRPHRARRSPRLSTAAS